VGVGEEHRPVRHEPGGFGVEGAAVGGEVVGHPDLAGLVAFRFGDGEPAPFQVDVCNGQGSGLDRAQPAAVDHPQDRRDDQVPDRAPWQQWRRLVRCPPDRGDLLRGVDVRDVPRPFTGQIRRDHVGRLAETDQEPGELPDSRGPVSCGVVALARPLDRPRHADVLGQISPAGELVGAHGVEPTQDVDRPGVGVPQRALLVDEHTQALGEAA
jgi:hypothetical protein